MSLNNTETPQPICIAGIYIKSDKYPGVKYKLAALERLGVDFAEINRPAINSEGKWSAIGKSGILLRTIFNSLAVLILCVKNRGLYSAFYFPYPSLVPCFFMSCLPGFARPKPVVIDFFISIYDTVVFDRKLLKKNGLPAKFLWWLERRSLSVASTIVVDTPQNAEYFKSLFNIENQEVVSVPLATGVFEGARSSVEQTSETYMHGQVGKLANPVTVLFIGTMIPLHGIETILQAADMLQGKEIHFTLIGDGQQSKLVESFLQKNNMISLNWIQEWQSSAQMRQWIKSSDICLGVFSATEKAQRVCPLKIYHYMSMSKPTITGETDWTKGVGAELQVLPFLTVPCGDSTALAEKILSLASNRNLRNAYSKRAESYFNDHLQDDIGGNQLKTLLMTTSIGSKV